MNGWKNGVTTPLITLIIYHDLYDYDVFPLTIVGQLFIMMLSIRYN